MDGLEDIVEPPGCDAIVGVVGRHVVDAVVLDGQDQVQGLQHLDVPRQAEVRVRPLVDL